jgi:hypothetical protein
MVIPVGQVGGVRHAVRTRVWTNVEKLRVQPIIADKPDVTVGPAAAAIAAVWDAVKVTGDGGIGERITRSRRGAEVRNPLRVVEGNIVFQRNVAAPSIGIEGVASGLGPFSGSYVALNEKTFGQ